MIRLQDTASGRVLLTVIGLIIVAFGFGVFRLNAQAEAVNNAQARIDRIIDEQSPLIFAFENTGASGRLTFEVTCERPEEGGKYKCVTKQTEPVVANLTPVPTSTATATPQPR